MKTTACEPHQWAAPQVASGTCYRVLLWEEGAFSREDLQQWATEKKAILQAMRDAGIKGARGHLAQYTKKLKALNFNAIESPLLTGLRPSLSLTRVDALANALRAHEGTRAYRLGPCCLQVLVELEENESLPELLKGLCPAEEGFCWCQEPLIEAMDAAQAALWQEESQVDSAAQALLQASQEGEEKENETNFHHLTVLAQEAAAALCGAEGRVLVDATLGGGGHTERLLQTGALVWGIDQDPHARAAAQKRLVHFGTRLRIVAGNFSQLQELLQAQGLTQVDGILADIGVSSPQLDCAERGFSFMHDGPLDMRMNPQAPLSAADIVNSYSEEDIANILWQYGEERASRAIARRIVQQRQLAPITTTAGLVQIISSVLPRKGKQNPATRSFQALRIAVNDELGALNALIPQAMNMLRPGGRLAIITFHSLEDRAVKQAFNQLCKAEIDRPEWPEPRPNPDYCAKHITRKPLLASEQELQLNPRARSAKLRVIEKI